MLAASSDATGYIPDKSLVYKEEFDLLYAYVDNLPIIAESVPNLDIEILIANYRYTIHEEDLMLAKRGLYVLEAMTYLTYNPKQYVLVAHPSKPLKLNDVDARVAPLLKAMRHTEVDLSRSTRIELSEL